MNAIDEPDGDLAPRDRPSTGDALPQVVSERGGHGRHARERTKTPPRRHGPRPSSMPPTMVAPERDTPGTSASVCQAPIPSARPTGVARRSSTTGCGPKSFGGEHDETADDERRGDHGRALVQHALDPSLEQGAGDCGGQECRQTTINAKRLASRIARAGRLASRRIFAR